MLIPKLTIESKSTDGKLVIITDATGAYSAEENEGGYGGINPLRSDLNAVMLPALHSNGEFLVPILESSPLDAYATDVSTWNLRPKRDGYYDLLLVLAVQHNPALSYPKGKIVFDSGKIYYSLQATIASAEATELEEAVEATPLTDGAFWKLIDAFEEYPLLAPNTGAFFALKPYIHGIYTDIYLANETVAFAKALTDCQEDGEDLHKYVYRDALKKAAQYSACWGDHAQAGEFLDELTHISTTDNEPC